MGTGTKNSRSVGSPEQGEGCLPVCLCICVSGRKIGLDVCLCVCTSYI